MVTKKIVSFLFLVALSASTVAQQATLPAAQPSPDAQQQEEKEKLEKQALALLDQVVTDSQGLRLPENKIRVQIAAADMLWDKSAARARDLLTNAAAMLAQIMAGYDRSDRDDFQMLNQLRQELVLSAGRHDAELGYQLLRSTQPPAQTTATTNRPGNRPFAIEPGNNLEQSLLATIAAHDPKFAYQKTVESLDKGEFPTSLNRVLNQLQTKEPDLFKKLTDKTLSRLASDNLLASRQATTVATGLLFPGPRANTTTSTSETVNANTNSRPGTTPLLNETAYRDLLESAITAALSFTGSAQTNMQRGGAGAPRVMRGQATPAQRPQQQNPPDEAQTRQNNARTMLFSLQGILPHIEQYAPARAQAVRQKLTELGVNNNNQMNFGNQVRAALQDGGSSDSLIAAAASAPPQAQNFIYREAAQRAIEEGNTDRALQIANEHLNEQGRNAIVQAVDFKLLTTSASPEKLNEIKQKLAALSSDS